MRGTDWLNADPYLWRHLADHAAAGNVLDLLVKDVGYLAVADPTRLLPALPRLTDPEARRIAGLYLRTAARLYRADPIERMALLHLTAQQESPDLAPLLAPLLSPRWRCRWAAWQPASPHRSLTGHDGSVMSVAVGEVDGEPVIVSGGDDATVRMWDARTGQPRGAPLTGHSDWVMSVAVGEIDGEPVIVSGGYDATVRMWDARTREPRGAPLTGHDAVISVAVGEIDGEPVIISGGDDRTVRVWEPDARRVLVTVELAAEIHHVAPGWDGGLAVALRRGLVILDLSTPLPP